ncbi:hypothetical protein PTSG_00523 [Salpingoeca rosetta]|uniref:Uncharacterized protein n=1 Tax=Salpingoeca rosetta (strain ATCC 50818 / BSB-021) TaxID=946362 RepID=F2TWQ0_SALR5|nr:uncharacterized protein PTSG_00523 [Salpingoeca rosetta]EGD72496.1 hypothetical protein PTSG_00523 [Salpingoeca rosetta]|eukprot:XP_004999065.1 hypothetical protein PTSG_00523 [Salpingoeca rosetta]
MLFPLAAPRASLRCARASACVYILILRVQQLHLTVKHTTPHSKRTQSLHIAPAAPTIAPWILIDHPARQRRSKQSPHYPPVPPVLPPAPPTATAATTNRHTRVAVSPWRSSLHGFLFFFSKRELASHRIASNPRPHPSPPVPKARSPDHPRSSLTRVHCQEPACSLAQSQHSSYRANPAALFPSPVLQITAAVIINVALTAHPVPLNHPRTPVGAAAAPPHDCISTHLPFDETIG